MRWLAVMAVAAGLSACTLNADGDKVKVGSGPYRIDLAARDDQNGPEGKEVVVRVRHEDGRETAALIQGGVSALLEPVQAEALLREASARVEAAPEGARAEQRIEIREERIEAAGPAEPPTATERTIHREKVRVRLPGIDIEADEGGDGGDRARVRIGFGADRIEVQALDLNGKANAVIKLRGDAELVRKFLEDQEELSPEVRAQMFQALGLAQERGG